MGQASTPARDVHVLPVPDLEVRRSPGGLPHNHFPFAALTPGQAALQFIHLAPELIEPRENLAGPRLVPSGFPLYGENTAWLEDTAVNLAQVRDTLPVGDRRQLRFREQLLRERGTINRALVDQNRRFPLQDLVQPVPKHEPHNKA